MTRGTRVRRAQIAVLSGLTVAALTACSVSVRGMSSPAEATSSAPSSPAAHAGLPGGAQPTCLVADNCGGDDDTTTLPAGVACAPLGAAMAGFGEAAAARFPGGSLPTTGSDTTWSPIVGLVLGVVDDCGFQ